MTADKQYFSTSLEKGLKILSLFEDESPNLTQTQISHTIGLNMTSTYRFVNTLVKLGYLEKDPRTKELQLGLRSLALGTNIVRTVDSLHLIKTLVDEVHERHNITIDVVLAIDNDMMRAYHRQAKETLTYHLPGIARNSLYNTSVGKAYLSTLPEDALSGMLDGMSMVAKTANTIVDKDQLRSEIKKTRQRGFAICVEEYIPGLITIGAPLINCITGKGMGAVSFDFSIIQQNATTVEQRFAGLVVELARDISTILQGKNHDH